MKHLIRWWKIDPLFNSFMLFIFVVFLLPMVFITATMLWYLVWQIVSGGTHLL